jgi:hypothetical protein
MKASKTTFRIAIVLGTAAAFAAFASSAFATSAKPAAMTHAEYQALTARSQMLNDRYGNAVTRLSPVEFTALWQAGGHRMDPDELVALVTRSEAINEAYDRLQAFGPQAVAAVTDPPAPPASPTIGFAWSDAGIGAAAMLGAVLLAGGLIVAARHTRRAPTARVS